MTRRTRVRRAIKGWRLTRYHARLSAGASNVNGDCNWHLPRLALACLALAGNASRAESLAPEVLAELQKVAGIYKSITADYVKEMQPQQVLGGCMRGMLRGLDEQSDYLDAEALSRLVGSPSRDRVGVGLELALRSGLPMVVGVSENSPAERAGLRAKDYLLELDGESLEESSLESVLRRLQGAPGSQIALSVRHVGDVAPRQLVLKRAPTPETPSVSAELFPGDLAYVRVRGLRETTSQALLASLTQPGWPQELKGMILDLRFSPGGLLDAAVDLAGLFLPAETSIVQTIGRAPDASREFKAQSGRHGYRPGRLATLPLVVLVGAGTASGAEIIAGALQDHGRAPLVGQQTFGRGTIQTVRRISPDAAIKLTTASYVTPRQGRTIQGRGLTPDVLASEPGSVATSASTDDPGLTAALRLLAPS